MPSVAGTRGRKKSCVIFASPGENSGLEVFKLLLQVPHIQINCATKYRVSPLSIASYDGRKDVVDLLLKRGGDPNMQWEGGIVPLHLACIRGHADIVQLLLEAGADTGIEIPITTVATGTDSYGPYRIAELMGNQQMMALFEKHRQDKAAQVDVLSLDNKHRPDNSANDVVGSGVAHGCQVGRTNGASTLGTIGGSRKPG